MLGSAMGAEDSVLAMYSSTAAERFGRRERVGDPARPAGSGSDTGAILGGR